jgi:hypothetical protein
MNATATIVSRIARVSLGLVVAGVVLGQTGTAFADTAATAATPAAYSQALYPGDADPGTDAPPAAESTDSAYPTAEPTADPTAGPTADPAGEAQTPAPALDLTLSGSTTAELTSAEVSSTHLSDTDFTWELTTRVDGAPLNLTFTTAHYQGAKAYRTTGITDEQGGLMTLDANPIEVATNGFSTGTFTVDGGETTGSVDADLDDAANGHSVHVSGTWTCS